jgi:hypothetical protein
VEVERQEQQFDSVGWSEKFLPLSKNQKIKKSKNQKSKIKI